jgi:hypothetical protein
MKNEITRWRFLFAKRVLTRSREKSMISGSLLGLTRAQFFRFDVIGCSNLYGDIQAKAALVDH